MAEWTGRSSAGGSVSALRGWAAAMHRARICAAGIGAGDWDGGAEVPTSLSAGTCRGAGAAGYAATEIWDSDDVGSANVVLLEGVAQGARWIRRRNPESAGRCAAGRKPGQLSE